MTSITPPRIRETWEGAICEMRLHYTGDEPASFLVSILSRSEEDLEVSVEPIEDIQAERIGE